MYISKMLFDTPPLSADDHAVLGLIREQRDTLRHHVGQTPLRWRGFLRRTTFARAMQASNSIEGINASLDEATAIHDDEKPESLAEENYRALVGYRNALTYVLQVHDDPHFDLNAQFLKSLHFMIMNYDMEKLPGQWRTSSVFVVHEPTGETVYEGPDADIVPRLMTALVARIESDTATDVPLPVRAAMAHLNLAMIHPFKDGNGRMARAIQTLVMAREGILPSVFSSIEEWLGRNTTAYYDILAQVGQGAWNPGNDATPWVRFCLKAHYQQAATLVKRNAEIGRVWQHLDRIIDHNGLPPRTETALIDAAFGFRVRNQRYRTETGLSNVVASRDLKRLCDVGLLKAVGEKRGRYYVAGDDLRDIRAKANDPRKALDPYALVREGGA